MVDRILMERILADIRTDVRELRQAQDITWEVYQRDKRLRRFVERTLHVLIEGCLDAAQHLISDQRFREPVSYRDTFVVLAEEELIAQADLPRFEQMAAFRNPLVHYYERIDDTVVFGVFKKNLDDFDRFVDCVAAYLERLPEREA